MLNKERLKYFLLNHFPVAHTASGGKEVVIRCPFCGDSQKDKRDAHFYIGLQTDKDTDFYQVAPKYHCFLCNKGGTLSGDVFNFERNEISTLTALSTTLCCFILLFKTCKPFNFLHRLLFGSMLILFLLLFFGIPSLFNFADFSALMTIVFICNGIIAFYIYSAMEDLINYLIVSKLDKKYYREF